MESRYDYMWEANTRDDEGDGDFWPDPLSINYDGPMEGIKTLPDGFEITEPGLKKLWLTYYKATGLTERDDILYQVNDIPNVGMLEPGDTVYMFNTNLASRYSFTNLKDN